MMMSGRSDCFTKKSAGGALAEQDCSPHFGISAAWASTAIETPTHCLDVRSSNVHVLERVVHHNLGTQQDQGCTVGGAFIVFQLIEVHVYIGNVWMVD